MVVPANIAGDTCSDGHRIVVHLAWYTGSAASSVVLDDFAAGVVVRVAADGHLGAVLGTVIEEFNARTGVLAG